MYVPVKHCLPTYLSIDFYVARNSKLAYPDLTILTLLHFISKITLSRDIHHTTYNPLYIMSSWYTVLLSYPCHISSPTETIQRNSTDCWAKGPLSWTPSCLTSTPPLQLSRTANPPRTPFSATNVAHHILIRQAATSFLSDTDASLTNTYINCCTGCSLVSLPADFSSLLF